VIIFGTKKELIIDWGSTISIVKAGTSPNKMTRSSITPFGLTGKELAVTGVQEAEFWCGNVKYSHQFHVCVLPTDVDGILGMDFLARVKANLNLQKLELSMLKRAVEEHATLDGPARRAGETVYKVALTVFTTSSDEVAERQAPETSGSKGNQSPNEVILQDADSWLVKTTETIKLAPRARKIVVGQLEKPKRQVSPELVCVEPAQIPLEGILAARGLAKVTAKPHDARSERAGNSRLSHSDQLGRSQLTGQRP
jgi:hypothetical protein